MDLSVCLPFTLLNIFLAALLVFCQDQSGFISLDCGSHPDTNYREKETGISYISDANFTDTGDVRSIEQKYWSSFRRPAWRLRSFPKGSRNCCFLNLTQGGRYLIRAIFLYGNYDGLNDFPTFHLHLGPNFWASVSIKNATTAAVFEMIHLSKSNHLQVCVVKTGSSTPFISALELRKLPNATYPTQTGSLQLFNRFDHGSETSKTFRYSIDPFDRGWPPYNNRQLVQIGTNETVNINNDYKPPEIVMKTASVPKNPSEPMKILLNGVEMNAILELYVCLHISELQRLKPNDTREFNVFYNGKYMRGAFRPIYLETITECFSFTAGPDADGKYEISLQRTGNSTLPPLLNALEVYTVNFLPRAETKEEEVDAMLNIKSEYDLNITSWEGDPCAPQDYRWDGLNCSYNDNDPPKITYLNLSSSGLMGTVLNSIFDLTNLEILDLSNNSLTGLVPEFLAKMETLKVLNLSRNMLNGSVPASLLDKSRKGSISLSIGKNPGLCTSASCSKKKKKTIIVAVVASIALVLLLVAALATLFILKKDKKSKRGDMHSSSACAKKPHVIERNRRLTYSEVLKITNNFEKILGRGGFGVVYYGVLDNNPVAVKMLTEASTQGSKQFKAEVDLLLRVHHKNLTSLVGYCDDSEKLSLIYEFMANGDLKEHLSGKRGPSVLTWEERLRIAAESAQGLEYLHNGCKPEIVHRDVKTTNILLNEAFQAKLADFGLSRSFPSGNESHVSTVVAGTPGYLDPEYHRTNQLSNKSDVYSFGVVLLEIITNQSVISRTREPPHIGEWVGLMLERGDIIIIADPNLQGDFDANSVWKAVEIAMACLNPSPARRPTMTQVVQELNESLTMERVRNQGSHITASTNDSSIELTMNITTDLSPRAR